ncbi:MAG: hypothetical protein IMY71_15800 [Bacteroidetes bacterium]|nr:hypothetical protein [Bacteroidota bacterium]
METDVISDKPDIRLKQQVQPGYDSVVPKPKETEINSVFESFTAEGDESFLDYINWLGLLYKTNVIVLSATQHYYYNVDDLAEVGTIINLKQLNREKQIGRFLKSIAYGLLPEGTLVGCFIDHNRINGNPMRIHPSGSHYLEHTDLVENGIISPNPIFNRIINILDSRIFRRLTENIVRRLLKDSGFRVENMTEINGITYFYSRKNLGLN